MVKISSFSALRYRPDAVGDLSCVIAPPYDVIDAAAQDALYRRSPYNIVRLILGTQSPGDTDDDNRYTRARKDFDAWCRDGVLQADAAPALYVIEHTFSIDGRTHARMGFIALLGLDDQTRRSVHRHEATLAAPKADRTKLLEAVPANLSPIFCVYPDAQGMVQEVLRQTMRGRPVAEAGLAQERIRMWALTDSALIQRVTGHFAATAVLIADGHHRFEVACSKRSQYPAVMAYFVAMHDPALIMRPIHRILQHPGGIPAAALRELCQVTPSTLEAVVRWLGDHQAPARFGWYDGRTVSQMTVAEPAMRQWLAAPSVPGPMAGLDVSVLHGLLLPRLGVDAGSIRYTASAVEAAAAVDRGEGTGAWLLRPIDLANVYTLASQGFSFPPKSTYFYPKVLSGLTINPLAAVPVH